MQKPKSSGNRASDKSPANPFDQLLKLQLKVNRIKKEFQDHLKTDAGIAQLKAWTSENKPEKMDSELSKKSQLVLDMMKNDLNLEHDFYLMAKARKPKKKKDVS